MVVILPHIQYTGFSTQVWDELEG